MWPSMLELGAPARWAQMRDVAELEKLLERLVAAGSESIWPDHVLFGPMSRRDWGVFCHKHFDHHLRQFGV